MITDEDRNVRTLIVSFVVAIMALIPLRFYEIAQDVGVSSMKASSVQVLGATTVRDRRRVVVTVPVVSPVLEAPWDVIDGRAGR